MGLPQGSILSPVLLNVYLEEALKSSRKLEEVRKRGDLLAFADGMLVMSNNWVKARLKALSTHSTAFSSNVPLQASCKFSHMRGQH